ncbi:MAG TPA: hypothetical protein DCZ84_02390 [Candidatus Vogelbacteria bacterium]|uniref:Uncharacterized protein n=1 Tax=Candidatus Vogelbacteria bacterium RIFOXYD1_FULL_51_18 TaxID=1802440 RepID=A0A1G2QKV9_9BACT|nr:MAG: hypothetical protein A2569_00200 [Candidatus Vogelbacteria bacterium RIFOXYD1_FULL_51_18]HBB65459.1 hypothetical protein [Candidatus Vogelbacteria bacterium]HBC44535.1 hypothetical protein [Candidatus Vogelbacteria bacterium]HCQ91941.1 hypothetical protein [Candidatus Vogelbacteria bacterium]
MAAARSPWELLSFTVLFRDLSIIKPKTTRRSAPSGRAAASSSSLIRGMRLFLFLSPFDGSLTSIIEPYLCLKKNHTTANQR